MTCELPRDRLGIRLILPPKKELSELRSKMAKDRFNTGANNAQICTNSESESIA